MQIVGKQCQVCSEKIVIVTEVHGCLTCEIAWHDDCNARPGICPLCSADIDREETRRRAEKIADPSDLSRIRNWPRYQLAFWLGFFLDLYKRSWEPATPGPLSILIIPFAAGVSGLVLLACAFFGLLLRDRGVMQFWSASSRPAWIVLVLGAACFMVGILRAHHAFFERHASADVANGILWTVEIPGFIAIIFSVMYWPLGREREESTRTKHKT